MVFDLTTLLLSYGALLMRFKMIADEFKDIGDEVVVYHLFAADDLISKNIRAPIRDNLIVYLAAHNIDLSFKRKGAGGQVTSVSEGKLNINYAVNTNINSEYDLSSYGGKYMALLKSVTIAPITRSCL